MFKYNFTVLEMITVSLLGVFLVLIFPECILNSL